MTNNIVPTNKLALRGRVVSSPASYVSPGHPKYPKDLSRAGRKEFKRLCRLLEERRTLTEADDSLLRIFVITHERHRRAIEHIEKEGEIVTRTITDKEGNERDVEQENRWLRVAERAEKSMVSILDRLGLTPRDRDKVKVTRGGGEDFIELEITKDRTATQPVLPALPPPTIDV